jgi:Cdc6-like AAA superfamily ATPase
MLLYANLSAWQRMACVPDPSQVVVTYGLVQETTPFTYVEINGLRIPEPAAAYNLLWETISGHDISTGGHLKVSSKEALKRLSNHFSAGVRAGPGGHAWLVVILN